MFQILSWLSADSNNRAFFLGMLTAAAVASAYIFWGPNSTGRRKTYKGKIPGLFNFGKFCFINAVLQSLASSPKLVNWLGVLNAKFGQPQQGNGGTTLITALHRILMVLNGLDFERDCECANADEVLNALRRNCWAISNDEQDAHEMFHALTTTIEEELQKGVPTPSLADAAQLDDELQFNSSTCMSKYHINLPMLKRKETQRSIPCRGLLASQLRCRKCKNKSPIKFDSFDSLSLSIPSQYMSGFSTKTESELTLEDCLNHFMKPEHVHDVECEKCGTLQITGEDDLNHTKARSTSLKQLTIGKLPDVLCIHIQRMMWRNNGMPMKQYQHITFLEYLDMSEYMYSHLPEIHLTGNLTGGSAMPNGKRPSKENGAFPLSQVTATISQLGLNQRQRKTIPRLTKETANSSRTLFQLQAVIVHLGDVHSGHFITYRRGALESPYRKRWFLCSDMDVHEVTAKEVFGCNAYMLLFERIRSSIDRLTV